MTDTSASEAASPLARFSAVTRAWFAGAFAAPTPAQAGAWEAVGRGEHALVIAPTGSGKTLAAFLWSLDRLLTAGPVTDPRRRCRVVYVSPLKALAVDVERNLRAPLAGLRQASHRLDAPPPDIRVAVRSGDTPAAERRRFGSRPPDILITTPESLFLILTSRAREALAGVDTIIVDEVHAVAGNKRGAHLALSLERLDALLPRPAQRIGLSATVRPACEVARFLAGGRPVTVVQPPVDKPVELEIVVPVEDMAEPGGPAAVDPDPGITDAAAAERRRSIWPHVERRVLDVIESHRSTLVFANSRRLAERLCARLNELAAERREGSTSPEPPATRGAGQAGVARGGPAEVASAHHGSVSREERRAIEEALKAGRLPAVVATSSLELGIDMGAVDLVVQVEAPPSVASGLQRVGRAGHRVGAVSRGMIFPKYRGDLLAAMVVAERMRRGEIEELRMPRNPLDVLAQQVVAMTAMDEWPVDDLWTLARRAAPFATLPRSAFEATLDMLSGRYPGEEFVGMRPRLVWDRALGRLRARPGAARLAVTSGGTIPDRGTFGVHLVGERASRVGELDEEMVYESRVGEVFVLGASSWRIEDITPDRVVVTPAPGVPGKLPFWHGDTPGRPVELGRALGATTRELAGLDPRGARDRARAAGLDAWAADNLIRYLDEQRQATGHVPDDRTLLVERFRDELGDWRMVLHSPYGARLHAPWALAVAARLRERYGVDVQALHTDDGIVLRVPDVDDPPAADIAAFSPEEIERVIMTEVGGSALFAARFRECAARALLLPRRRPGGRLPLWQQRQRAAQLLEVASRHPSFPVVLEAVRECLQDVFDLPALLALMHDIEARRVRLVEVETPFPSPFAQSLLFRYVGAFMYQGDAPLAERRAQALALDSKLLAELLGQTEFAELLDADVIAGVEAELQRLTEAGRARDAEDLADLVRELGPLTAAEVVARGGETRWLAWLEETRRVIRVRIAGQERFAAIEDAGRLRDALGTPLPVGVPEAFTEPVADPLGDLVSRHARTHGPFTAAEVAARYGLGVAVVSDALRRLAGVGGVVAGAFQGSGGPDEQWCDTAVLRRIRRRSLARLRREVEPSPPEALAVFLPAWQGVVGAVPSRAGRTASLDALVTTVERLQGVPVPASTLESLVLPARVPGYTPDLLDELTASGEVVWAGAGALPGGDGWITLCLADMAPLLLPEPTEITLTPLHRRVMEELADGGALFFRTLSDRVGSLDDQALAAVIWDLVWAGQVAGDTLLALRAVLGGGRGTANGRVSRQRRPSLPARTGPPTVAGRWWRLPARESDPTRRAHALATVLLDRHGVLTRGAVAAERPPGGFAALYPVLRAFEEAGRCRRGYFVEGLGGAQFAVPGAVDRMRALRRSPEGEAAARPVVLAATDPANPYGAALPWPTAIGAEAGGHRPGRKAGAVVVLVAGRLVLYLERGGRALLSGDDDPQALQAAVEALARGVREGRLDRLTVERVDGAPVFDSPLAAPLREAGFHPTPRGLRLRR